MRSCYMMGPVCRGELYRQPTFSSWKWKGLQSELALFICIANPLLARPFSASSEVVWQKLLEGKKKKGKDGWCITVLLCKGRGLKKKKKKAFVFLTSCFVSLSALQAREDGKVV